MAIVDFGVREFSGHVVVSLRGELDVASAAAVAAALEQVAALACQIIVDLEGLDFIDSSGLAALVRARKYARNAGGDLLLARPQQHVQRVLGITRVTEILSVHPGVEDAARTLRHSASGALSAGPGEDHHEAHAIAYGLPGGVVDLEPGEQAGHGQDPAYGAVGADQGNRAALSADVTGVAGQDGQARAVDEFQVGQVNDAAGLTRPPDIAEAGLQGGRVPDI